MDHNGSEIDRRSWLKGAAGTAAVAAVAAETPALAQDKGARNDAGLKTESLTFKNGDATIKAFLARPKADGKRGAVIVVPDIFGMTEYIQETTSQVAQAGLVALCVDFYSRATTPLPGNDFTQLRAYVTANAPDPQIVSDMLAGIAYLKKAGLTNGKFGITGFCMGGRATLLTAAATADIVAASPYYGPVKAATGNHPPAIELTDKIKGAVQGHYGATDMNPKPEDVKEFYDKLKLTNPHGEYFIYEGAGHAFHSYGRPSFKPEAAAQAWGRTLEFFKKTLK